MSVLQIKGRTTNSQNDFDNFSLSSNSLIYTTATPENVEEFSIELTLGSGWNDSYSPNNKNLTRIDDSITIQRHGSIVIEVEEEIRVPHNRYGIVLPTGSMFLSLGIIIAPAKVEPAFVGRLKLRMFNTTNQKVVLQKGVKLGSVVFFSTESSRVHNITYRASEISASPASRLADLRRWLLSNKAIWIGWIISILTSSIVAFGLTYFLYYNQILEKQEKPVTPAEQETPASSDGNPNK